MIKIEITDPHTLPKKALIDIATYLMKLGGIELCPAPQQAQVEVIVPAKGIVDPTLYPSVQEIESKVQEAVRKETLKEINEIGKKLLNSTPDKNLLTDAGESPAPTWPAPAEPLRDLTPPSLGWPLPAAPMAPAIASFPEVDPDLVPRPIKTGVDTDVNGVPWDSRIHTRTKSKNANGTWKIQRGLDLRKVEEISEQLRASVMDVPAPPPESEELDFNRLMLKITGLISQGKITQKQVVEAVNFVGLPSLAVVGARPEVIPGIVQYIDALVGGA